MDLDRADPHYNLQVSHYSLGRDQKSDFPEFSDTYNMAKFVPDKSKANAFHLHCVIFNDRLPNNFGSQPSKKGVIS